MSDTVMNGTKKTNLCAVSVGPRLLEIQERQLPDDPIEPNEVFIKVIATGICGSDCHSWDAGLPKPLTLGHESVGIIMEVGADVKDKVVGQRVAIEPRQACLKCYFCLRSMPNSCQFQQHSSTTAEGTMCQYYRCDSTRAIPIGDEMSWNEAGCIQPLAVAVELGRRGNLRAHQTITVFGCGPLGLLIMALAKSYGAKKIIAFDVEKPRVDFAVKHYANVGVVCPKDVTDDTFTFCKDFVTSKLQENGEELGVDVTIEVSGVESALLMAMYSLKAGGTYIQAGLFWQAPRVPMLLTVAKQLRMVGTVSYGAGCFEDAVDLINRKAVDVSPMVTKTYPLTKAQEAFEAQISRREIKIVILSHE